MSLRFIRLFQPALLILGALLAALAIWLFVLAGGATHLALLAPFRWHI